MSHVLQILLNLFLLALVVGGGGWLLFRAVRATEDPSKIIFKLFISLILVTGEILFARRLIGHIHPGSVGSNFGSTFALVTSIAACCVAISVIWGTHIGNALAHPLTSIFDGGNEPPEPKPLYSTALGRRKFNRPLEAIMEIRKQLAKFPNDFEGVMLLAAIQAEDMKDLASAEITLNNFCAQAKAPPNQIAGAWTQLADWHLKLASDVDSAQQELEKIIARFPDTELALHAEQRIAHLTVGTRKILLEAHDRPGMVVPEGVKNLGLRDSTKFLIPEEVDPGKLAAMHVKHLAAHPHDSEVREKLAMIYANDFQRLDLATLELMQLINEKRHSAKQIAGWLNLLANFQVNLGAGVATVRATLEKIVEDFPDLPVAEITRRRLARLNSEFKGKEKTPGVKLGVYEQNIGLKYGSPRKL